MEAKGNPIAALATAIGPAGITVLRMSGLGVFEVADRLIRAAKPPPSARPAGSFFHANIFNSLTGNKLDDGLVLIFRAPRSYTGEDAVEIHGHGGAVSARRLLDAALQAGARLAEPGEFTRRAFLNGRMDLTQAEAVADLIQAHTDRAAESARVQLAGALGARLGALYDLIATVGSDVERMLDLDEDDLPAPFLDMQTSRVKDARMAVGELLDTWREGRLLRDGALVVIAGRPNVGKSSLLNALLGHERAIVTAQAGTTRDTIEEFYCLNGIPLRLVDTAGIRETNCEIEKQGIARTRKMLARADAVLYVMDGSEALCHEDLRVIESLPHARTLLVLNKQDLSLRLDIAQLSHSPVWPVATLSAHTGDGVENLRQLLSTVLGIVEISSGTATHVTVSERHRRHLIATQTSLSEAGRQLESGLSGLILAARELREAAESIGPIIGRTYTNDLLDLIFKRFCVGK